MGIKNFNKLFTYSDELKFKDLKNKCLAIDAMYQLHRTARPFKNTSGSLLKAPDGTITNHINGIIALIFNLKKNNIKQIWIFDNLGKSHNTLKELEIQRRKSCIESARKKLEQLPLFSDTDEEKNNAIDRNKYERASFSLEMYMITDLQLILDSFDIPWIESPQGFEAEQLAAYLTNKTFHGIKADAVLTPDPDCLLFGAKNMIRNDKLKNYIYNLSIILKENNINKEDLIKIGIILGCDFAEKTPKIGPKSVLKKFKDIILTDHQEDAFKYFTKPICENALAKTILHNLDTELFSNKEKISNLFNWLTNIKGFNTLRMQSRFNNAKIFL
jgi:flap endonuclease-1